MNTHVPEISANSTESSRIRPDNDIMVSVTLVITAFGLVGNVMCILVMSNKAMRCLPFAVYSGVLAVNDSCILIVRTIITLMSRTPEITNFEVNSCFFISFYSYFGNQFSSWTVVQLTLERMIAVVLPMKCHEIITRKRAVIILISTGCILLIVNVHSFWTAQYSYEYFTCDWKKTFKTSVFFVVYIWADIALFFFVPATCVIVLNSVMIRQLCYVKQRLPTSGQKHRSAAVTLFAVSIAFVSLTAPFTIHDIYHVHFFRQPDETGAFFLVTYAMWLLNHAVNFYLYSLAGTKVRSILIGFCYQTKELVKPSTVQIRYQTRL